jgi:hypothetical protein
LDFLDVSVGVDDRSAPRRSQLADSSAVLELHADYSRQLVHAIFSPDTVFVPGAGTWGLHGIVDVPHRPGDYVFFVTFGQSQGAHQFDEFVNEHGILSWQSQPQQGFNNRRIKNFIQHNEEVNDIYLFLRTDEARDYTYLGTLKYHDHDPTRERPVYFQWQILDWPPTADVVRRANLMLTASPQGVPGEAAPISTHRLSIAAAPVRRARGTAHVGDGGRAHARQPDYLANHEANQKLGLLGELLVLRREKERLTAAGLHELAAKVRHVSVVEDDTAGYDILSFDDDGSKRFIEVKTTRSGAGADFFMSTKELVFSALHSKSYHLYRLYDYVDVTDSAKYFVLKGDVGTSESLRLLPTNYKVSIKSEDE